MTKEYQSFSRGPPSLGEIASVANNPLYLSVSASLIAEPAVPLYVTLALRKRICVLHIFVLWDLSISGFICPDASMLLTWMLSILDTGNGAQILRGATSRLMKTFLKTSFLHLR